MMFVDLNMELHAAPIAKLGARKCYRLPFCAVFALCLLTVQVIAADQRPVLGQGNISCSLWLEGRQTDSPSAAGRTAWVRTDCHPYRSACPPEVFGWSEK